MTITSQNVANMFWWDCVLNDVQIMYIFKKNDNVTLMNGIGDKHTFLKYDLTAYEMTYVDQLHILLASSVSIGNRPPN